MNPERIFDPDLDKDPIDKVFLETEVCHNRLYQSYSLRNRVYMVPIDDKEKQRLDLFHEVRLELFKQKLIYPKINSRLRRVLDCGYGTGAWAIDLANENPTCQVLGVDIHPSFLGQHLPANLYFQVLDLNQHLNFSNNSFDLVNSQMLAPGLHFERWEPYIRDIHRILRPGGWCQMVELYYNIQSDNGTMTKDHALRQWSIEYQESLGDLKDLRIALRLQQLMRNAGFRHVEHKMIQLPTCSWPADTKNNTIGILNGNNFKSMLSSLAAYPMISRANKSLKEVSDLVARAQTEADDHRLRAYIPLYICIGRKSRGY